MISTSRKMRIGLAPRSSRSKSISSFCPSIWMSSLMKQDYNSLLVRRFQNFHSKNVIRGDERHRTQIAEEIRQPQSSHRNRDHYVEPGDVECNGKVGLDDPEQVDVAHQQKPRRQPDQARDITLEGTRYQHHERHRE